MALRQGQRLPTGTRIRSGRSKYRNVPTVIDGIRFDSKREAHRWRELRMLEWAGEISDLKHHEVFPLHAAMPLSVSPMAPASLMELTPIAKYEADFTYVASGQLVVEDVKGWKTLPLAKLKQKWFKAEYGITIREIR